MKFPNRKTVERLRMEFPKGTVVELVHMNDEHAPPPGTLGTVMHVDDIATIHVCWQNGSSLGFIVCLQSEYTHNKTNKH